MTQALFLCSITGIAGRCFRLARWEAATMDWGRRFGAEVATDIMPLRHELTLPGGVFDFVWASPSYARKDAANKPNVRIWWW